MSSLDYTRLISTNNSAVNLIDIVQLGEGLVGRKIYRVLYHPYIRNCNSCRSTEREIFQFNLRCVTIPPPIPNLKTLTLSRDDPTFENNCTSPSFLHLRMMGVAVTNFKPVKYMI